MAVMLPFNELTHVGSTGALLTLYCALLPVVAGLREAYCLQHFSYSSTGPVPAFRNYLYSEEATITRLIGARNYRRVMDLFVHFLHPKQELTPGIVGIGLCANDSWKTLAHSDASGEFLCITCLSHIAEQAFLRWAFANGLAPFSVIKPKMQTHGYKHYKLQGDRPSRMPATRRMRWVKSTGGDEAALFRPGLMFDGKETEAIVKRVLLAAYALHRLTCHKLDRFSCSVNEVIGASRGAPTSSVMLDVNANDEFHIYPVPDTHSPLATNH